MAFEPSGKDLRKCKSIAYHAKQSQTARSLVETEKLDYGSAKLEGKLYKDQTCIDQAKSVCANF